jgi:ABC-type multidrug transport system, permease component
MQKMIAIVLKDLRIRFSTPIEWLFFLILPIFFSFIIGGGTGGPTDSRVGFYVVDEAQTSLSASLIDALNASTAVRPVLKERQAALKDLDERDVAAVLLLPAGLDWDDLAEGPQSIELRQLPGSTNALVVQQGVQTALREVSSAVQIANFSTEQAEELFGFEDKLDRNAWFTQALTAAQTALQTAPERVQTTVADVPDQIDYDPNTNSSIGQMITWVFIPLIGLSAMLAYERQIGTLRRLLTSPTSKAVYLGGTIIGMVLTGLLQMTILVAFGKFVLGVNWGNSVLAIAMMLVSSSLAAAALGTMLGTLVKTASQASGLSMMVGMVMAMLGGCWYPLELFPQAVQSAVRVLPTTWAMQGMLDITLRGQGPEGVLLEMLVLGGFALVFFLVGIWRFKYE